MLDTITDNFRKLPQAEKNALKYLRTFQAYGVDIAASPSDTEARGTCPVCDKNTFYVKRTTNPLDALWSCRNCHTNGNPLTFIRMVWQQAMQDTWCTTDPFSLPKIIPPATEFPDALADIHHKRNISITTLQLWGVCVYNGTLLVPCLNRDGKLVNIYRYDYAGKEKKPRLLCTPNFPTYPFGLHLHENPKTVIMLEGPWDGMAIYDILYTHRPGKDYPDTLLPPKIIRQAEHSEKSLTSSVSVYCVPGCEQFKPTWSEHIAGTNVLFAYDNDHPKPDKRQPALDGMVRAVNTMLTLEDSKRPANVHFHMWGGKESQHCNVRPNGYDVGDLVNSNKPSVVLDVLNALACHILYLPQDIKERIDFDTPVKGERELHNVTVNESGQSVQGNTLDSIPCTTYLDLLGYLDDLHTPQTLQDTFAAMLASMAVTETGGVQLWFRVIGPPGSGKSTLAQCMSAHKEYVYSLSNITGFHSGFRGPGDSEKDSSLIPDINGRTLMIKDGDMLISSPNLPTILAELRDLYDGDSASRYRNLKESYYESIRTNIIVCGTNQIRGLNRTNLGERFLDVEIIDYETSDMYVEHAYRQAINCIRMDISPQDILDHETKRKRATIGFMNHLKTYNFTHPLVAEADDVSDTIQMYAKFLAHIRAREHEDELDNVPEVELHTRITAQLVKLIDGLTMVYNTNTITDDVMRIVRKVVFDTCKSYQLDIVRYLYENKEGATTQQVALDLSISDVNYKTIATGMRSFGVLTYKTSRSSSSLRIRNKMLWKLTHKMRRLCDSVLPDISGGRG